MIKLHGRLAAILAAGAVFAHADMVHAAPLERVATSLTDTLQSAIDLLPEDVTNVRIGIGPGIYPAFEGSNDYSAHPVPVISLRYKGWFEIDNNEIKITAFNQIFSEGAKMKAGGGTLKAGPLVSIDFGRGEGDSPDLHGMGNVGTSFELGAFVAYAIEDTRFRIRARQDVADGHHGATVTADITQTFLQDGRWGVSGNISTTWASANYMKAYFGVNARQAAASGLPFYHPGSDIKDAAVGLNGSYALSAQWSIFLNADYERLVGDAGNSPLVRLRGSRNQFSASSFIVYSF